MRSEVDKIPLAEQKWKVIISGGFLLFSALVVVSFFSSTFDFGDEFDLFDFTTFNGAGGTFDVSGAPLSDGLTWDTTTNWKTEGKISVVPEPSRLLLILVGLGGAVLSRRRW